MNQPPIEDRTQFVQKMFTRIAKRYDLLNRLMTFGRDRAWRDEAIDHLQTKPNQLILDDGAGTGDLAIQLLKGNATLHVIAVDLTFEMIAIGKKRPHGEKINWVVGDAQNLPFKSTMFDGVISGYLLRNVPDVDIALSEQYRVTNASGRVVSLDTTPPGRNLLRPLIHFYLKHIIPLLGRFIAGAPEAYTYLPETTTRFLTAEELAKRFEKAGFMVEGFVRRMFGSMAIHWGNKE
jgi:demethylmenaquinone methyltransferase/2-methoxy-6-polyprenyl-1,4-benzoquinol methylase